MWWTFSWGDTVEGIWPCSFSVSQFLRASSSHSACILSQNSVSDWKIHSKPRRVEYELHRSASAKLPAVSNLNNETLCINIDEGKSCSWNFVAISDCLEVQKVSYCTKVAMWLKYCFVFAKYVTLFKHVESGHTFLSILIKSWTILNNEECFKNILMTTGCINIQCIYCTSWTAHFFAFYLILLISYAYKAFQLFINTLTIFCALLGLRTTQVMVAE